MTGDDVQAWTTFLVGAGLLAEATSTFTVDVYDATRAYQRAHGLGDDGIVGNGTMGQAMRDGYPALDESETSPEEGSAAWPPRPDDIAPLSFQDRAKLFGTFAYKAAPVIGNPEAIQITDGWVSKNIVTVTVPQLVNIPGAPGGRIALHKALVPQVLGFFSSVEDAGLLPLIRTFGGAWAPRFVRGSKVYLSNHAWGTAMDFNPQWNALGTRGALVGEPGSVRKLVPLAVEHGLYSGLWFTSRPDAMHFEAYAIL